MVTDLKGNVLKPGTRIIANLSSTCVELEIIEIKEGGMVVQHDRKSGQALVTPTEVWCKILLLNQPNAPLAASWEVVMPPKREDLD